MKKIVSITCCARCGLDHKDLEFSPLTIPDPEFQWWAPCPTNGEPVLMQVIETPSLHPVCSEAYSMPAGKLDDK